MTLYRIAYMKILIVLAIWWGCSALIDFFIIPTVFSTIGDFFKAGNLGISVFTIFNLIEIFLSSVLLVISLFIFIKNKKTYLVLIGSAILSLIANFYFWFLTPKLSSLTSLWKKLDFLGEPGTAAIPDIQQAHQYYHQLYIGLDGIKLLLMTIMITLLILKEEKWR